MAPKQGQPWQDWVLAGGVAGMIARTAIAPVERVKILYQIERKGGARSASWLGILPRILREEGVLGCWRGNSAAVLRVVPYMSVQFVGFEKYKLVLHDRAGLRQREALNVCAGSLAGMTGVVVTYPLDTARARLAAQMAGIARPRYSSMLDVLVRLPRERGMGALYEGMSATLVGVAPYAGLKFGSYELLKDAAVRVRGGAGAEGGSGEVNAGALPAGWRVGCGMVAGAVAQTFVYPFDVIRRRFQTSDVAPYKGVWDALRTIAREEGVVNGLFRGLSLNYIKTIPNVAIYMSLYDVLKLSLAERRRREDLANQ
eukprot:g367.t1